MTADAAAGEPEPGLDYARQLARRRALRAYIAWSTSASAIIGGAAMSWSFGFQYLGSLGELTDLGGVAAGAGFGLLFGGLVGTLLGLAGSIGAALVVGWRWALRTPAIVRFVGALLGAALGCGLLLAPILLFDVPIGVVVFCLGVAAILAITALSPWRGGFARRPAP